MLKPQSEERKPQDCLNISNWHLIENRLKKYFMTTDKRFQSEMIILRDMLPQSIKLDITINELL